MTETSKDSKSRDSGSSLPDDLQVVALQSKALSAVRVSLCALLCGGLLFGGAAIPLEGIYRTIMTVGSAVAMLWGAYFLVGEPARISAGPSGVSIRAPAYTMIPKMVDVDLPWDQIKEARCIKHSLILYLTDGSARQISIDFFTESPAAIQQAIQSHRPKQIEA